MVILVLFTPLNDKLIIRIKQTLSFVASDSKIVKYTSHLFRSFRFEVSNWVYPMLRHEKIVCWPCFQVINVFLPGPLDHQICLFPVDLIKDLREGISVFFCIMVVKFIHVEGEVRQHLIIELIEVRIFQGIIAVNLSKYIAKDHKHSSLIEHLLDF